MVGDDDGIHAGSVGRAGDGTEVAHIGHAVEHQDEGVAPLLKDGRNHVLQRLIFYRADKRHHALMVLSRQAVHLLDGHKLHGHAIGTAGVGNLCNLGRARAALNINLLDLFLGTNQFQHGVDTKHHIVLVVVFHGFKFSAKIGIMLKSTIRRSQLLGVESLNC